VAELDAGARSELSRRDLLRSLRTIHDPSRPAVHGVPVVIGSCCHHRVCVAVCPERALRAYEIDGRAGVALDAAACTGCGRCAATCPEQALVMQPPGPATEGRLAPLTAHRLVACVDCDDLFAARDGEPVCPTCRKSRSLFMARSTATGGPARPASSQE
jgi:Pyruvate/2-oxoacid:ferredoxin oxidoreductase delta subunit